MPLVPRTGRALAAALALMALIPGPARGAGEAWIPGYAERVAGEVLHYHAPQPGVEHALLVRSLGAERFIEWETAPVPVDYAGEWVTLVWLFGIQVNVEPHAFELSVDGAPAFRFENPVGIDVRDWRVAGPGGAELRFRATLVDRFDDLMGYAVLRLPRALWTPGRPLRLRVTGESAGSRAWYMTFQSAVAEEARLTPLPAVVRDGPHGYQPLRLEIVHLGEPAEAVVAPSFGAEERHRLDFGANAIELRHPPVESPEPAGVVVSLEGRERHSLICSVEPVRPWTIHLVQHTHTDVGYTRPQSEILPAHLRFLDRALDLCDETDDLPDDARFRWTCEASWAVREYLESRTPEQVARLRRRVEEGRIEVTAMFLNMCEVVDEASYAAYLAPIRAFREAGLPVTTAMQNDINGAAWCLADYFADVGVEYLTMGQHGHRALVPFERATSFWWESPAGSRILAFRADHYMTGNFWGVHTGRVEAVEDELLRYLAAMEHGGYPFERVAVQYSGYPTDNSAPSSAGCELVRRWNERYVWPRLRSSVAREFPSWVKEHHAGELPVLRAAWPDWWTDGFGSAARESAAARLTQGELVAVEGLLALERALGLEAPAALRAEAAEIRDALLFYGEHTFGADESIRAPFSENTVVQWAQKSAYAWDAVKRSASLREAAMGRFEALLEPAGAPRLLVVNTLGASRSGLVELYVDHELWPHDRPLRVLDEEERALPLQRLRSRDDGSYWALWARDVPAFGYRTWRVEVDAAGRPPPPPAARPGSVLENRFYRVEVDPERGAVASLFDKELGRELVDPDAAWGLGQLVHETLGNREQLEAFVLEDYARAAPTGVELEGLVDGPLWQRLALRGELPGCEGPGGVRLELRLFHEAKRLELHFTARKRRVLEPEALYVAFPFALPEARVAYETLGGVATPGSDLIPGTSADWQAMQGFVAAQGPAGQVVLASDEIPLIQLGGIRTGEFQRVARVERPHVFSWVINNYWTTNFKADQEGDLRWSYALTSDADASRSFATRFGARTRTPLLARAVAATGVGGAVAARSLLSIEPANLALVSARPASRGDGIVLLVREVEGRETRLAVGDWRLDDQGVTVREVSVLEDVLGEVEGAVVFRPFEPKFLLLAPAAREEG